MELPIRTNTDAIRWVIKYTEGNIILWKQQKKWEKEKKK
jgi:hypothetical protein